jgi:hypothetical protein
MIDETPPAYLRDDNTQSTLLRIEKLLQEQLKLTRESGGLRIVVGQGGQGGGASGSAIHAGQAGQPGSIAFSTVVGTAGTAGTAGAARSDGPLDWQGRALRAQADRQEAERRAADLERRLTEAGQHVAQLQHQRADRDNQIRELDGRLAVLAERNDWQTTKIRELTLELDAALAQPRPVLEKLDEVNRLVVSPPPGPLLGADVVKSWSGVRATLVLLDDSKTLHVLLDRRGGPKGQTDGA